MGPSAQLEIDSFLRKGGIVVTASERAARTLLSRYHLARQLEGLTAWAAPAILDWKSFVRKTCAEQISDARLVLNPLQEQMVWAAILEQDNAQAGLLQGPRFRLAAMAAQAHEFLCTYAPRYLRAAARAGWQGDPGAFSGWLAAFDERCRTEKAISAARLPLALLAHMHGQGANQNRPPLLLVGFDRLLPVQRSLFDAWGVWSEVQSSQPAAQINFYRLADRRSELEACALWCSRRLTENPAARILVVAQNLHANRGQIERSFLRATGDSAFEFSLGIPLSHAPLPRAVLLFLRWLAAPLAEHEVDWLLSSGYGAANPEESKALQEQMWAIRRRNDQQPEWTLPGWLDRLKQRAGNDAVLFAWASRVSRVLSLVNERARQTHTAREWAEFVPHWLESLQFAASSALTSAEFQAWRRWQSALETAGSVGFDGRKVSLAAFLSLLARACDDTVFALESHDAPIQITGPAESSAMTADAVWFLGVTEDAWPAGGSTHPLLPLDVQREAEMPHADPRLDWTLAQSITARLIRSADEVHFSYAQQNDKAESRPSRLILQSAGAPLSLPPELADATATVPHTVRVEDFSQIPFAPAKVPGGASILTYQSQCPFKAFAKARLGADSWEPAQACLTPAQRGQLLHAILHRIWAELRGGVPSLQDLRLRAERERITEKHVTLVFQTELKSALAGRLPERYLKLEQERLTRLISAWLDYEAGRAAFEVLETEVARTISIAGLSFDLRLDRIDKLNDNSLLVIDYKTGDLKPKVWELPRPDDIQLPLYAGFALDEEASLGGLVFAKVRVGKLEFSGHLRGASTTLMPTLNGTSALMRHPLRDQQLSAWREAIEQLAQDFLAGHAEVDPREYPQTCERCGLQALCRVNETRSALAGEDDAISDSGFAEIADA